MTNDQFNTRCPRCGEGVLRGWNELTEEEQWVVRSMPESVDYSPAEREALHMWCTNCWHEETESGEQQA
jgi:hypothetical protein